MLIVTYIVFFINPFLSTIFILIGAIKDRKYYRHYAILLAGVFACAAYWVIPKVEMDLTRYFAELEIMGVMEWDDFVSNVLIQDFFYIKNLLFFIVGKSGKLHLLPSIVIFVSYFIMFYMLLDYSNKVNARSSEILLALFFIICVMPFISLVSNVRNILAFSIISFAVYRELIQGKKGLLTIIFYSIPLFIHISSITLIFIRLAVSLIPKIKGKSIIIGILSIMLFYFSIENSEVFSSLPYIGSYLEAYFLRAKIYLTETSSDYVQYLQSSIFAKAQKLYFTLTVIYLLLILFLVPKGSFSNYLNRKLIGYFKYICFVVIATYPIILTVYFRFTMAVIMFSFICLVDTIKNIHDKRWRILITMGIFMVMLAGLLQQLIYFNALAYLDKMFSNLITRSFFNMFIQ